jgi:hypothetical protein
VPAVATDPRRPTIFGFDARNARGRIDDRIGTPGTALERFAVLRSLRFWRPQEHIEFRPPRWSGLRRFCSLLAHVFHSACDVPSVASGGSTGQVVVDGPNRSAIGGTRDGLTTMGQSRDGAAVCGRSLR